MSVIMQTPVPLLLKENVLPLRGKMLKEDKGKEEVAREQGGFMGRPQFRARRDPIEKHLGFDDLQIPNVIILGPLAT